MTQAEEDQIIATMVRERRRNLICIEEQNRSANDGFLAACEVVRTMETRNPPYLRDNAAYPPIDEFWALLEKYALTKARIAQLTIQIESC